MQARLGSLLNMMRRFGVDQLMAINDGMHSFLDPNPVFLLTGFKSAGECAVLLDSSAKMSLYVTPNWDASRANKLAGSFDVTGFESFSEVCNVLKDSTNLSSKIGVVGVNSVRRSVSIPFLSLFKSTPIFLDDPFYQIAMKKTEDEIENARKATEIAELGYKRMLEAIRSGISERKLASEIDCHMKALGADDDFLLLAASQHNRAVHAPLERRIEEGDVILAEISPSFRGQFVQICRTVAVGKGRSELYEKYSLLASAFAEGARAAVPGTAIAEVVKKMNEPLEKAGYGKYCHPPYMRVRGHGLGLSSILPGDISEDNKIILEEDMLFVMHPNQYIPETGYMMCGEPVLITTKGAEPLNNRVPHLDRVALN